MNPFSNGRREEAIKLMMLMGGLTLENPELVKLDLEEKEEFEDNYCVICRCDTDPALLDDNQICQHCFDFAKDIQTQGKKDECIQL